MATVTFDITKVKPETLKAAATFGQCEGLSKRLAKRKSGKIDWADKSRIRAHFLALRDSNKFTFKQAHDLFQKDNVGKLPQVYRKAITKYLKENKA